jgi:hypothetical protein
MSYGGRNILINASLSNSAIYCMSMFLFPKTTIKNGTNKEDASFGRGEVTGKNITWSSGSKYAKIRGKESWELKI